MAKVNDMLKSMTKDNKKEEPKNKFNMNKAAKPKRKPKAKQKAKDKIQIEIPDAKSETKKVVAYTLKPSNIEKIKRLAKEKHYRSSSALLDEILSNL